MTATAIAPVARGTFATVNPATGEQIETFTFYDAAKTESGNASWSTGLSRSSGLSMVTGLR
jgi:hypothetical protein